MSNKIFSNEYFTYIVENRKARLCRYHGFDKIVTIPDTLDGYSVKSIGWGAFLKCESLVEVRIPRSVISIDGSAFYGCENLTRVQITDSVTSIGEVAFGKCFALTEIELRENHPVYSFFDRALFDKTKGILLTYFGRKDSPSYVVPDFVISIAHRAFMECCTLTSVVIPSSVTTIEHMAFYGCKRLQSVIGMESVTSIGRGAFAECKKLKSVENLNSVTSIEDRAFEGCKKLKLNSK